MKARDEPILLPGVAAPYLKEWFQEIGPTTAGAMGEAPIGWQDLAAWQTLTGIELGPFEARTIRRMSEAYLSQRYDAKKPNCPPPYSGLAEDKEVVRARVDAQFKAIFGALQQRQTADA